jgi:hypothetical protein
MTVRDMKSAGPDPFLIFFSGPQTPLSSDPLPVSLLLVVRNSFGMGWGDKGSAIRAAAGAALARLTWRDTFAVVYFHSDAGCLVGYGPATPDRVALAVSRLAALTNYGTSRMLGGLEVANALLGLTAGTGRRRVVLLLADADGEEDDSLPLHLRHLMSRKRAQRFAHRDRQAATLFQAWTAAGITILGRGVALDQVCDLVRQWESTVITKS